MQTALLRNTIAVASADTAIANLDNSEDIDRYESDLIELLAQLDQMRHQFSLRKQSMNSRLLIQTMMLIVDQVMQFADRRPAWRYYPSAADTLRTVDSFNDSIKPLKNAPQASGIKRMLGLGASDSKAPEVVESRLALLNQSMFTMYEIVERFFITFTDEFQSSKRARGWVEAAASFLVSFKRDVHSI